MVELSIETKQTKRKKNMEKNYIFMDNNGTQSDPWWIASAGGVVFAKGDDYISVLKKAENELDELNHAERQADQWSVEQGRG